MPNIFEVDKKFIIRMLKMKNQVLVSNDGKVIYPEDLEKMDIDNCCVNLHA